MNGGRTVTGDVANRAVRSGSALIIVLWTLGLLSLLIGSFAFDARVEARIISYYRKRSQAVYLAKSGVEIAEMLLAKSGTVSKSKTKNDELAEEELFHEEILRLSRGLTVIGLTHEIGGGTITVDIIPEPARRNINNLGKSDSDIEASLEKIFEVGGIAEDSGLWPVLIESFLDWTDKDNEPRPNGAETEDYYGAMTNGYSAKNGPLDTVGELLLIKGYNQTILSGGVLKEASAGKEEIVVSGIEDLLTTYGDGKVNVNAASYRVLMTLPDMDDLTANAIIEEREGGGADEPVVAEGGVKEDYSFKSVGDFITRVPDLNQQIKNYVTTESSIYRISSVGEVGGVKKKVWCIARYANKALIVLRWREED